MKPILLFTGIMVAVLVVLSGALLLISSGGPRNPLAANGEETIAVMAFAEPVATDPPAAGWFHSTFWTRPAMTISQATVGGMPALRLETKASGSIFGRYTDIAVADYPTLAWSWRVETPIDAAFDESTAAGDDHAARLYLRFADTQDGEHSMEIIWSNGAFAPGTYKDIGDFRHYVAHSGTQDVGAWIYEAVDLARLYRDVSGRDDAPRITMIAIFCDSDDTGTQSLAYFGDITLRRR
jgi:hypothetical protein